MYVKFEKKHVLNWTYRLFGQTNRVATLLNSIIIIILDLESIRQF